MPKIPLILPNRAVAQPDGRSVDGVRGMEFEGARAGLGRGRSLASRRVRRPGFSGEAAEALAVEIVAFPRVQLLDVAGPLQVFASANDRAREAGLAPPYAPRVVALPAGHIAASAGLTLVAAPLSAPRRQVDTLLVAGGPGVRDAAADAQLLRWITRRARHARRTASVCTGAFVLAAAGLLHGRRATTHWRYCAELAHRYPAIKVESDPIFVRDGNVWTSAGVTAGIDLALAFVEADLGREVALAVARQLVVFARRPGGQAQFSASLALSAGAEFDSLHDWMARNLQRGLSVGELAAHAGMSERNFARQYRAATGTTPSRAVERLRVEAARDALGGTRRSIKEIARRCGFGSEETMRRTFLRTLHVAPRDYRARFPG